MVSHIDHTMQVLTHHLDTAERPIMWASGGKDSTVLLHLCRPWAAKILVLHTTKRGDDGWPGVTECLEQHCAQWGYTLECVTPWLTFPQYVEKYGWPVETVPTTLEGDTAVAPSPYRRSSLKVSSWVHCTYMRTLYPLIDASLSYQADLLLTGSRLSDAPANTAFAQDVPFPKAIGWHRCNPLAAWSTADIWAYVDAHGLTLPPQYAWKRDATYEAVDCMSCTWQPQHWATLQQHHPEEYAQRWPVVEPVYAELRDTLARNVDALDTLPLVGARHG